MTDKEFKKLSRAQLIDIIYQFQLQVDELEERNKALEKALEDKRIRIDNAGNLAEAAAGEYDEWHNLYPSFAAIARAEGFGEIAKTWDAICVSEKHHEKRYRALLANLEEDCVFKRSEEVFWKCRNCGYIHYGNNAPEVCPACVHSKAYFELLAEIW